MNSNDIIILKTESETKDFNQTFFSAWDTEGGLVTTRTASKLLGISDATVHEAVNRDMIKSFIIGKQKFLSLRDVLSYPQRKTR